MDSETPPVAGATMLVDAHSGAQLRDRGDAPRGPRPAAGQAAPPPAALQAHTGICGAVAGQGESAGAAPPLRVLFVVNSLAYGGAEKHVVSLLNNLDRRDFRLSLAYLKNDVSLLPQIQTEQVDGRILCCAVRRRFDLAAMRRLARQIDAEQIDVLVAVNGYSLAYAALAIRFAAVKPQLVDIFHSSELLGLKTRLQMLCYRPFFARCDMLVYVCENQRRYWHARMLRSRQDTVIHNGIELSRFTDCYTDTEKIRWRQRFGWAGDDFVIGLCAGLRPEKAHTDLLVALARLPRTLMHVRCLFIGDGPERPRIERMIIALGLAHKVGITGYLPDVRLAIAACDVMALVSHTETFSLATLEAMAMGKAVIMTDVGGAAEQIDEGVHGYLVEPGNAAQLAQRIADLLMSGQAKKMGQAARQRVLARFSHLRMAAAYQAMFSRLASRGNN